MKSLTVEEAVARMVNMDYIPTGFTLLEMIAAFKEEAEVDYENARIDQRESLIPRMDACRARYELAKRLMENLQYEVDHPSKIVLADDSYGHQRLTFQSVAEWAADRFGIGISKWTNNDDDSLKDVRWEDVTIKIWKDNNIGVSFKKGEYRRDHFRRIGLMGDRKNMPNKLGGILIGLSEGKKYPKGKYCEKNEKTAISRLRDALYKLISLPGDPFLPHNECDGWRPKFKLIYDVNNADDRVKKKATHVEFDDTRLLGDTYDD